MASALLVLVAGWGCSEGSAPDAAEGGGAAETEPLVVYLVRHAERDEDGTNDPPISEAGRARAELVARMLADAGIQRIHATAFNRTVQTAAPMAMDLGLDEVEGYDGRDLASLNDRLRGAGGRHLVVGHSNTTWTMVEVLGGEPGPPIEEFEYDRLYIVTVLGGQVSTTLIRFGAPSPS
jgi:phosphohistidine phosphatase SixA